MLFRCIYIYIKNDNIIFPEFSCRMNLTCVLDVFFFLRDNSLSDEIFFEYVMCVCVRDFKYFFFFKNLFFMHKNTEGGVLSLLCVVVCCVVAERRWHFTGDQWHVIFPPLPLVMLQTSQLLECTFVHRQVISLVHQMN